ncbi:MAG: glucosamine-6-phosphate deaminase [Saccharofermentanales bacterium]
MITIKVFENYDEMSAYAAEIVKEVINSTKKPVLGLATGSTPIGLYNKLIEMNKNNEVDFSQVTSINLDEYVGLAADHPQSYSYFMNKYLFRHINIDKNNTFVPNGLADDLEQECKLYDQRLRDLGYADIQILGIGQNGHIGFNEPGAKLNTNTNITNLTPKTIKDNSRFFDSLEEVPKQGITLGLEGIFKAKKIVLVANGFNKSEVCKSFADEYIDTQVPASLLKLHKDIVVCLDKEAASLL